jgi:hypothetical protein
MNSDRLNRWLTLAANIGVLAGILFLAYELQQNTLVTRLEAAGSFQNSFSEIELFVAGSPEFAELLVKGREGGERSREDELRLTLFYSNVLRKWQFVQYQYLSGALDEGLWRGNRGRLVQILGEDRGLLAYWRMNQLQFSPAFNEMMTSITTGLP